jgi:micrococcal nuclease
VAAISPAPASQAAADPPLQPTPSSLPPASQGSLWRVVGVTDGDLLTCLDETNLQQKVRLAEIDAPELGQDYGMAAREALADLVFGKTIRVVDQGKDRSGRWIARVYVDGVDVNRQLVAEGYAWHYAAASSDASLDQLQQQARQQRLGLWSGSDPVPPWIWRQREASASTAMRWLPPRCQGC